MEFKTNRQFWSIIGGILLAVVLNVDGLRIFRSYMQNPALAGAMAARIEDLERVYATAAERLEEASDGEGESSEQEIEAAVERLRGSVEPLLAVGVPIGWRYAPHCHLVGLLPRAPEPATDDEVDDDEAATSSDSACIDGAEPTDWIVWLGTLVSILGTGVLIGLGAPFWFDVARRLAVVRTLFGAVGGGQDVHRGETLEPGPQKDDRTDALIDRVVADAYAGRAVGARRLLIDGRDV